MSQPHLDKLDISVEPDICNFTPGASVCTKPLASAKFVEFAGTLPEESTKHNCRMSISSRESGVVMRTTSATFGFRSEPCCISVPMANQKLLAIVKSFSNISSVAGA